MKWAKGQERKEGLKIGYINIFGDFLSHQLSLRISFFDNTDEPAHYRNSSQIFVDECLDLYQEKCREGTILDGQKISFFLGKKSDEAGTQSNPGQC